MSREAIIIDDITNGDESLPVSFSNEFDDETPPQFWKYTSENVPGPDCNLEDFESGHSGCQCIGECSELSSCLCVQRFGPAFDCDRTLLENIVRQNLPVVECGTRCSCSYRCGHRLVQFGITKSLQVFKTLRKGLGLRTLEPILKLAFVCEYSGEVIGKSEACKRFALQKLGDKNYIYVLREHGASVCETIVDPTVTGNVGRFLNHSCTPNLIPVPIRSLNAVPRVCLFTLHDVVAGEELCYDYSGGGSVENSASEHFLGVRVCSCESKGCRRFLPFDKTL